MVKFAMQAKEKAEREKAKMEAQVEKLRDEVHIVVRLLPGERDEDVLEQFVITKELVRTSLGFELKAL